MKFALTDDQRAIQAAVRDLLAATPTDGLWRRLAEMGVCGVAVPEAYGGAGLTEVELAVLLTEVGYAAVPLPVAETAAVAGPLLAALGDPDRYASRIAAGELRVALVGPTGLAHHGGHADLLLGLGADRLWLTAAALVTAIPAPTMDPALAAVRLPPAWVDEATALPADPALLDLARDRATLAAAAQLVGLARRLLDLTVNHVRQREQFGVPVGGFQAVKHQLADVLLAVEFAAPTVLAAAWAAAASGATANRAAAGAPPPAADTVAAYLLAADAAKLAARTGLQCHGAIGYTVEYPLHRYAKRVWALTAAHGYDTHLDRLGDLIGLPSVEGDRDDGRDRPV